MGKMAQGGQAESSDFGPEKDTLYMGVQISAKISGFRGCRIVAITSAFQADDAGSIPATRSRLKELDELTLI